MEILIDSVKPKDLVLLIEEAFRDGGERLIIRKCADCDVLLVLEDPIPDEDGKVYCRQC